MYCEFANLQTRTRHVDCDKKTFLLIVSCDICLFAVHISRIFREIFNAHRPMQTWTYGVITILCITELKSPRVFLICLRI